MNEIIKLTGHIYKEQESTSACAQHAKYNEIHRVILMPLLVFIKC